MEYVELLVQLELEVRTSSGGVMITSPDVPFFSSIGSDGDAALAIAKEILPIYLKHNSGLPFSSYAIDRNIEKPQPDASTMFFIVRAYR